MLYIVSTPIGNLQDLSLRAIDVLTSVDYIACEDTRRTGLLLEHIRKITNKEFTKPKFLSYFEFNEQKRIPEIISLILQGKTVALISDAGTPLISDPGFKLVRECVRSNLPVVAIPGPSAVIAAVSVSGLPTDKFFFVGYPPRKDSGRIKFFTSLKQMTEIMGTTIICYEAPHRLQDTLAAISTVFPTCEVAVASELTKMYESVFRGSIEQSQEHFATHKPRGEYVIVFHALSQ